MTAVDGKQLVLVGGYKENDNAIYKEVAVFHTGAWSALAPCAAER